MALSLIMDGVVAALLVATIVFAVRLNSRLAALRNDSERLQGLIKGLQSASNAAEDAVAGLKATAGDAGRTLQQTVDQARSLDADLRFLTERAGEIANRLEAGLRMQRDQQSSASAGVNGSGGLNAAQQAAAAAAAEAKGSQSRLAMLLKQAEAAESHGRIEPSLDRGPVPGRPKPRASSPREAVREEPVREVPRAPEPREAPRAAERAVEPQSRAERELLRALEARNRQ